MVSPDSELNRTHPEWCLSVPGRTATLSRAQRVLDMTREDVQEYLFEVICAILDSTGIRYIKWDMTAICVKSIPRRFLRSGRVRLHTDMFLAFMRCWSV